MFLNRYSLKISSLITSRDGFCPRQVAESQLVAVKEEHEAAKAEIAKFEGEKAELSSKVNLFSFKVKLNCGCIFMLCWDRSQSITGTRHHLTAK